MDLVSIHTCVFVKVLWELRGDQKSQKTTPMRHRDFAYQKPIKQSVWQSTVN